MWDYNDIFELIFDNLKRLIFPEKWLVLDLEMSKQEFLALLILERSGAIIMSQIADYINISMSTATGIIDRLVKKGYVVRDRDEADRRIVIIKLSAKGKSLIGEMKERIAVYIKRAYEVLTEDERQYLFRILEKVLNVIQEEGRKEHPEMQQEGITGNTLKKIAIE